MPASAPEVPRQTRPLPEDAARPGSDRVHAPLPPVPAGAHTFPPSWRKVVPPLVRGLPSFQHQPLRPVKGRHTPPCAFSTRSFDSSCHNTTPHGNGHTFAEISRLYLFDSLPSLPPSHNERTGVSPVPLDLFSPLLPLLVWSLLPLTSLLSTPPVVQWHTMHLLATSLLVQQRGESIITCIRDMFRFAHVYVLPKHI